MKRHNGFGGDDAEKREKQFFAVYKADPEWNRIYSFLNHGYWHVTTPKSWEAIRESGAIKPNIDEQFKVNFDSTTRKSYGFKHNCVCLFDFISPSENETIEHWQHAWDVLVAKKPNNILLQFDRPKLEPRIIPNSEAEKPGKWGVCGRIESCEVWYPDEISLDAITNVYRVPHPKQELSIDPEPIPDYMNADMGSLMATEKETAEESSPLSWLEELLDDDAT